MESERKLRPPDIAAAINQALRSRKSTYHGDDRQLAFDAVDYWMGALTRDGRRALMSAMRSDADVSGYVLEVGAALQAAGVINTEYTATVIDFPSSRAPLVSDDIGLAAKSDQASPAIEVLEQADYQLTTVVFGGQADVALRRRGAADSPIVGASVSLVKVGPDDDAPRARWVGTTDATGSAHLVGDGPIEPPGTGERYVYHVT